jgi:type I restriction enzyme S subunit
LQFPALEEQRSIAQALSDVDALIAALDKAIAKKRAIKTATMQQLLTGKKRLPGFGEGKGYKESAIGVIPEDWQVYNLRELCSAIVDGTHYTPSYVSDGVPFYSVENVTADDFENTKFISNEEHSRLIRRCKPEKGDLLLTRIGSLGATKLIDWDIDASIYVSLALLKLNEKAYPTYVYAYSKSKQFFKMLKNVL